MSAELRQTKTDQRVNGLLNNPDESHAESVGILVSIDEDMEDGDCLLNNLVRKVDGEVSKELGFGIYKIYVPVARLNEFVTAEFVESVEAPDPDGGPVLMGN